MAKVTPRKDGARETVNISTKKSVSSIGGHKWWKAQSQAELCRQVIETAAFLKEQQAYRFRQLGIFMRLYGNMPLMNWAGSSLNKAGGNMGLPMDRPTMNIVQSCIDTIVSRLTQSRPRPMFLTDAGDTKMRNIAKQMNRFIPGEFYQTNMYKKGVISLRDSLIGGTGVVKVFEDSSKKVQAERTMITELFVDPNDSLYGEPRQLFQLKLVDRSVLEETFGSKNLINTAEQAYPDGTADSQKTIADQIMVVECWHLPSGKDAKDGRHVIACSSGLLLDEDWKRDRFPFAFLHNTPPQIGFWGQGMAEQLMGTQVEINQLLMTITQAIKLVGVPRVFVEKGSKIVKAHLNNQVGAIVEYSGTLPSYQVAPCIAPEMYQQLERLIQQGYQQSGVSSLSATAQKPAGLNSGEAIRNYDDLQSDRFAALSKRYEDFYTDLAYLVCDTAKDIAERDGEYQTVYPNKDGTREVDLPSVDLLQDPFVIQCFGVSSLPRDPAGRLQKISEMMQAGLIDPQEGRRLLDYPDIEQAERLANSSEERILKILDEIVETGKYTPPDPFMNLQLATKLCTMYYNLYVAANLSEDKAVKLRTFFSQLQTLQQASVPQPMVDPMAAQAMAVPQAAPTSELLPNTPQ